MKMKLVSSRCSRSSRVRCWRRGMVDNYCILRSSRLLICHHHSVPATIRQRPRHHHNIQKPHHHHALSFEANARCTSRTTHTRSLCPPHHRPQHRAQQRAHHRAQHRAQQRPHKAWPQSRPDHTRRRSTLPPRLSCSRRLLLNCQWGMQQTSFHHGPLGFVSSRSMTDKSRV